jgi:Fe-S cluster assembly protein SufD
VAPDVISPTSTPLTGLAEQWSRSMRPGEFAQGPQWLQALRLGAAREFSSGGLPGNRVEQWKYTSLRRLEAAHPMLGDGRSEAPAGEAQAPLAGVHGFGFRQAGGKIHLQAQQLPDGVTIQALDEVLSRPGEPMLDMLRPLLESIDSHGSAHAFEALNTALLNEGVVVHVAAGVDGGTCFGQWDLAASGPARLSNSRLLIILEAGARLRLVEQFQRTDRCATDQADGPEKAAGQALNLVAQARLADGSELQHVRLQQHGGHAIVLTFTQVLQEERSTYTYCGFETGGGLVRHAIDCRLAGAGANAEINGAFVLDQDRQADHHVCVDHLAPECRSDQLFRGVLGGRSRGVFNGRAVIRPGADGSKVRQSSANLLLSDLAEIDSKPELEIYADEVEASHGATVGSLDEQAVFYLRSRGIPESAARRLLTAAFCRAVTARLPDVELAAQVDALLEAAMPGAP